MKKVLLLPIVLCVLLLDVQVAQAQISNNASIKSKLVGEWKGKSEGDEIIFKFFDNDLLTMTSGGEVIGGENYELQPGVFGSMKYAIDATQKPIWLDMVIYLKPSAMEAGRMKGIIRFISDNKIEFRVEFDPFAERPAAFGGDDAIVIEKVSK